MEENTPKIGKYSLNYGLLLGLVGVVFGVMLYMQELHYEQNWSVFGISVLLTLLAIILGVSAYKKANGGYLKLVDALKIGTGIAVVSTIVSLLFQYVLTTFIEPDFMDKALEIAKASTFEKNPNLTEEQWQQGVEMQKKFAWLRYPIGLIMFTLIGLILGLFVGLAMKKDKPAY